MKPSILFIFFILIAVALGCSLLACEKHNDMVVISKDHKVLIQKLYDEAIHQRDSLLILVELCKRENNPEKYGHNTIWINPEHRDVGLGWSMIFNQRTGEIKSITYKGKTYLPE